MPDTPLSTGAIVREAQVARDDGATVQTPQQILSRAINDIPAGSNTLPISFSNDSIRTLTQTQATPPSSLQYTGFGPDGNFSNNPLENVFPATQGVADRVTAEVGWPKRNPGVGATSDDGAGKTSVQAAVDRVFGDEQITAQPNVLDQYSSYTYSISFYLMTPEAMQSLVNNRASAIPGAQLLFQSGGAPVNGRNPYFSEDYYIDRLVMESAITGKGSNQAHNVQNFRMTIVEPNGITLINNLNLAVQDYLGSAEKKKQNFASQNYLMVIRFYGYDSNGNLVQSGKSYSGAANENAVVEKYYPVVITNLTFKVANKLVEYELEGTCPQYQMPISQSRGSIPYNIELSANTVKEALAGNGTTPGTPTGGGRETTQTASPQNNTAPKAPSNASSGGPPKKTVSQGLIPTLNQIQQDLVKQGYYTYADKYSIVFTNPAIENAKILVKGGTNKGTGMPMGGSAADKLLPEKQAVDPNTRTISYTAGMQLIQVIDQILRNSTYVTEQANTVVSEKDGKQTPSQAGAKNTAWYKINLQAIPIKWDPKRNDYAYEMKYIISPFKISQIISPYFDNPPFSGVHKVYNYWFTGENTQVLAYEQQFNYLYNTVLSGPQDTEKSSSAVNELVKQAYYPRSGESSQGAAGRTNEITANAADYLYSPSDYGTINIQIVGDPAWLQQGEAFAFPNDTVPEGPFLPDGTINYDSSQILFEVVINTPQDYNMEDGLMNPNNRPTIYSADGLSPGASRQSTRYIANKCSSEFSKGKFTQMLTGSYLQYFPDQTVKQYDPKSQPPGVRGTNIVPVKDNNTANNIKAETSGNVNTQPNPTPVTARPSSPPSSSGDITPSSGGRTVTEVVNRGLAGTVSTTSGVSQFINREP